jgi:1-acyl-sn-glycerol-3-phosphate acyltransferase
MLGTLMYGFLYVWFHTMRLVGWFRWRVVGRELLPPREQGGMVVVMNHVNWVDIPIIGTLLPWEYRLSWLAKAELFENPLFGWWLRQMNVIPIKRGRRDVAAMDTVIEALRGGAVLLIFPEGTRSRDGILHEGRGGAVRMAMQAGVPIVPVAIVGTEHGPKGSFTRKPVTMTIGAPYKIPPTPDGKIPADMMEQLTSEMMLHIAALLPPERRGAYGPLLEAPAPAEPGSAG